jgi:KipI family sensor histidine kinase inhibitor
VTEAPRCVPAGDRAVTLVFGGILDLEVSARVHALDRALAEQGFRGFVESVPAAGSLLVMFDPSLQSAASVAELLRERCARPLPPPPSGRRHEIPVRYGGDEGPDLAEAAARLGMTEDEVVRRHGATEYTTLMLGFTPGFGYLGPVPVELALPRRDTPRPRVPAGSVALAGPFTGVYPSTSAGGWNLIGRAAPAFLDWTQDPPVLLAPGDRVRFVASHDLPVPPLPPACMSERGEAAAEVLDAGTLTTVQDLGRPGYRRAGVALSGAMDPGALVAANLAVGNARGAAVLECTLAGPSLRFLRPTVFAVAGADLGAVLSRHDLGRWVVPVGAAVRARPGNVLSFEGRRHGCRAYVALAGGIEVAAVLGSRSTDVGAGFGGFSGRALRTGDVVRVAGAKTADLPRDPARCDVASTGDVVELRVVPGPQMDTLAPDSIAEMLDSEYAVGTDSDRAGVRLQGPHLRHHAPAEILSDGMPIGSIQVPPDGQPILMAAEGPTTGGYVKPFVVLTSDLPKLGQLTPGSSRVRFRPA